MENKNLENEITQIKMRQDYLLYMLNEQIQRSNLLMEKIEVLERENVELKGKINVENDDLEVSIRLNELVDDKKVKYVPPQLRIKRVKKVEKKDVLVGSPLYFGEKSIW